MYFMFFSSRRKWDNILSFIQSFPPLDEEGQLILIPEEVLETREHKLRNMSIKEYLIKWKNICIEEPTWEGEEILKHPGL
jgi:hypothetical protein